jgi:hypothetical protein
MSYFSAMERKYLQVLIHVTLPALSSFVHKLVKIPMLVQTVPHHNLSTG